MVVGTFDLRLETSGDSDLIDITDQVKKVLMDSGISSGIVTIFVPGSTAGVTTIEYEEGALRDFQAAIERIAPKGIHYDHDARWGDGNGYSHIRASLLGPSLTVPFSSSKLLLGTWQQIVLIDFDNRPRTRRVLIQVLGE
jgi:secondary thiamine-phosphate synthase enzyme